MVQATVKSKVAGEVEQVTVREGQDVRQGDVIARIDTRNLQAQYDRELAEWLVQFKKQVGADENFLKLPTETAPPSLQLFTPAPENSREPALEKANKQKPRRRSQSAAA